MKGGEKMSVPEPRREKSKLEVCVKAHDLCCYTLQITANKKVFTEEYQRSLTDKIVAVALGIHCDCWNANNINLCTGGLSETLYVIIFIL